MATLEPIDVIGGAVRVAGSSSSSRHRAGIVLHRMPAWARGQHNDIALSLLETMPSGARLEMVTDATCIELDVHLTLLQLGVEPGPPAAFDVVVDGRDATTEATRTGTLIVVDPWTGAVEFEPGGPATIRFDGLPAGEKLVEVWLPHAAAVHLIELRADGSVGPPRPNGPEWVHYGSSISHCLEATRPTGRLARGRGPPRGRRPAELRVRGPVPARPVRRPDDRRATRRPHQPQARDQRRQRRHDARADLRPRRPRAPRHDPRTPRRRPRRRRHTDRLPGRRGPSRADASERPAGSRSSSAHRSWRSVH